MDGIVVIGEGEKDEAPMLAQRRARRRRLAAAGRHRRRPARGHAAGRAGPPERARRDRAVRARHDVRSRPGRLHGEDGRRRASSPTCSTSTARSARRVELIAERRGIDVRDVMVVVLDRPRHEEGIKAIREAGARVRLITDGDVAGALLAVAPDRPVDLLWGIGGTPEGVISAAALKCYRRRADRPPVAARRRRAPGRGRRRATTSTACSPTTTSSRATNCFFSRHRRDRRRRAPGRPLRGRARGDDRVARHAHRSGTVRRIQSRHDRTKLRALTGRYG